MMKATGPSSSFQSTETDIPVCSKGRLPFLFNASPIPGHQNLLIYFHGNAEDASYSEHLVSQLAYELQAHSLIAEYPGYGVYRGQVPDEKTISEDALLIYDFATNELGFKKENIIVVGRSMGSGPACLVASERRVKMLVLVSAYKSIKAVAKDHFPFFGIFVKERFENIKRMKAINQPVFLLHGEQVN